ncbi:MAG TPA: septum formation initiator family protein [Solirubrobacterales bacterium]
MAARAHAARRTATTRRRPAARRRPSARRGASRVQWDRVGRIALCLVLAAVAYSYLNPVIDFVKTYTATTAAKAKLHEVLDENKQLHRRVQNSDDPSVIAGKARSQGMIVPGETPYIVQRPSTP